jgi:hypothetical protein
MKLRWVLVIVALGCGKKDSGSAPPPTAEPAKVAEPTKPPEVFQGPLTVAIIMDSKDLARSLEPWDQAFAKLQGKLGAPTKVDGKQYQWAALDGDDCAYTYVTKDDGTKFGTSGTIVGIASSPGKYGKADAIGNRNECLKILGKDAAPEDPNALPPPADGKVTVGMLVDNAAKARSKWDGKEVSVTGVLFQLSTVNRVATPTTMLYLQDAKEKQKQIFCPVQTQGTVKLRTGKPMTVKATVKIQKATNGAGETVYEAELGICTIAK